MIILFTHSRKAFLKELYPNLNNPDRSFSEKTIFDDALERLSSEYARTNNIEDQDAKQHISSQLNSESD